MKKKYFLCFIFANLFFTATVFAQKSVFQAAPLFQDNMVLQQQRDVPVWGKGTPGTTVNIQTSWGEHQSAVVLPSGTWMMKVPTPKAGGPYQMVLRHGTDMIVLHNVLVGDVWLCSGQSNMEMPMSGFPPNDTIKNGANEIHEALFPSIRLFTVAQSYKPLPDDQCTGKWLECSPATAPSFSATAFYFGKILYNALHIPIGLISTNYGGTAIEAWMSGDALTPFTEFKEILKNLDQLDASNKIATAWIIQHPAVAVPNQKKWEGLSFGDEQCSARTYNDSTWPTMKLPTLWEQGSIGSFDGAVWFRKNIIIPSGWIGKDLVLQLGPIDDMDETYVNGKKVGEHLERNCYSINRVYKIDKSIITDSSLHIAVRVIDYGGGGGIWGNGTSMKLYQDATGDSISLEGEWKYMPVAEYRMNTFYVYGADGREFAKRPAIPVDLTQNTPSALYNAMVHPLVPFAVKGAIWYQGEQNVSYPSSYYQLLPALIADWRNLFQSGEFPFYYVQIAPYNYGASQSQFIREAQFEALKVRNTGMAVTMDIGNPHNIHPGDKEDVGKRLAAWALTNAYGKKMTFSGPLYKSMVTQKGKIILSFDYAVKGLVLKPRDGKNNFSIAGEDHIFKPAVVKIEGNKLIVSSSDVTNPVAVRYAWNNTDEGTLFNQEGLPSPSFRTDRWEH